MTSSFVAAANDNLQLFFNYLTSDGSGYADYALAGTYSLEFGVTNWDDTD